jgi:hypothetical protein
MQERASPLKGNRIDRYRIFNTVSGKVEFSPSLYALEHEGEKNLETLKTIFERKTKTMALNLPSKKSGLNLPKAQATNPTAKPSLTLEGLHAAEELKKSFQAATSDILARLEKAEKALQENSAKLEKLFSFASNDANNSCMIIERLENILKEIKGIPTAEIVQEKESSSAQINNNNYPGLLAWHGDKSPAGQQKAMEHILSEIKGDIEKVGIVNAAMGRSLFGPRNTGKVKALVQQYLKSNPAGSVQSATAGKKEAKPIGRKDWAKILGISEEAISLIYNSLKNASTFSSEEEEEIIAYLIQEGAKAGDMMDEFISHCEDIVLGN